MRKTLRAVLWIGALLGVVVFVLRMTLISWWTIPTDDPILAASLAPSLEAGDVVLLLNRPPTFGDLTRCTDPSEPRRFIVGRLMGEPNDQMEFEGVDVVVNNKRTVQEYTCQGETIESFDPSSGVPVTLYCAFEAIGGRKHMRATNLRGSSGLAKRKATVSADHLYLVSDNRVFPFDSREYGAVPMENCKEQIFFRIMSSKGLTDAASRFTFIQ